MKAHVEVTIIVWLEFIKSKYFYKENVSTYCKINGQYLIEIIQSAVNDSINFYKSNNQQEKRHLCEEKISALQVKQKKN